MIRVLHTSDLHGEWETLRSFRDFDLWIDSGDFFPNWSHRSRSTEKMYQSQYLSQRGAWIQKWLGDRPGISVPGNHDFISLAKILNLHDVIEEPVCLFGHTFSGFREIPFIMGEWMGETHDFTSVIERVFSDDPTILVTHCPPHNILDFSGENYGCSPLTNALSWRNHRIRHHFFGHIHSQGGKDDWQMGISFHNSATIPRVIEIESLK